MENKSKMGPAELKAEIGRRLKEARRKLGKGWTLKRVGELLRGDLGNSRIGNYEQGTRRPGPYEIKVLARLYGASAAYLMCLDEESDMTKDEVDLLRNFRALPEKDRKDYSRRIAALALVYRDPIADERISQDWSASSPQKKARKRRVRQ